MSDNHWIWLLKFNLHHHKYLASQGTLPPFRKLKLYSLNLLSKFLSNILSPSAGSYNPQYTGPQCWSHSLTVTFGSHFSWLVNDISCSVHAFCLYTESEYPWYIIRVVSNRTALCSEREWVQILCTCEISEDSKYEFKIAVGTHMSKWLLYFTFQATQLCRSCVLMFIQFYYTFLLYIPTIIR
jgi:hypothetical protein